jgi:LysR family glycine cleavage system transcriptional activator
LHAIAIATERVRPGKQHVNVTSVPSFAARWLVPRLPAFTALHPNTEVRVDASPGLVDLSNSDFDLAFREGVGKYQGTESRLLFALNVVPVATPAHAKALFGKRGPGWAGARLLHETMYTWWPQWFERAGVTGVDTSHGLYFSHTILALASALQGQGVALAPRFMVEDELAARTLTVVDERELVTGSGYYVVWPMAASRPLSEAAVAFRTWVVDEAARQRARDARSSGVSSRVRAA